MKKHDRLALLRQLDGAYTLPLQTFIDRAPGLDDGGAALTGCGASSSSRGTRDGALV